MVNHCTEESEANARKNRTVIVYFGIFIQYLEIIEDKARYHCIVAAIMTMSRGRKKIDLAAFGWYNLACVMPGIWKKKRDGLFFAGR